MTEAIDARITTAPNRAKCMMNKIAWGAWGELCKNSETVSAHVFEWEMWASSSDLCCC